MRPTRIIVGEVRAAECLDLLLALNAGLPGLATLHANSAREALVKLCTLPLLAGENISARFVVPTVASSVDLVVHLGIDSAGVRRVNEIVAVPGRVENDIVETEPVFVRKGGDLRAHRRDAHAPRRRSSEPASTSTASCARPTDGCRCSGCSSGSVCCWSGRRSGQPAPRRDAARPRASGRCSRAPVWARSASPGFLVVCAVCAFTATAVVLVASRTRAGGAGLRCDGWLPAGRGAEGSGSAAAARLRRGVARGRRQPGVRRARRHVPARGALGPVRARTRTAARRRSPASRSTTR